MSKPYSVGVCTLGCKVNQYESEAIAELFRARGAELCPPDEACDCYVINTCTVTAESDRKARQFIRRAVKANPNAVVLVTGCFSQTNPDAVAAIPGVDFVCGNRNKTAVVDKAFALLETGKNTVCEIEVPTLDHGFEAMSISRFDRTRAYVKIEDGCENRCAYCIIPSARGPVRSKSPEQVLREVEALTENGCREVVLTGIETASYGKDLDGFGLADLLCAVDKIPNVGRVRLGSLDPSLMKPAFVDRISSLRSLAPHFHLSMQSGSATTLAAMKRKYNPEQALRNIQCLREAIPNVQFTTDMIVGFPGETDEQFAETMRFAEEARFLMIHVFPYSRRKGTVADRMSNQVPEPVKHERAAALIRLSGDIRRAILSDVLRTPLPVPVLFETFDGTIATGHTTNFIEVCAESDVPLHGVTRYVLPTALRGDGLFGRICEESNHFF